MVERTGRAAHRGRPRGAPLEPGRCAEALRALGAVAPPQRLDAGISARRIRGSFLTFIVSQNVGTGRASVRAEDPQAESSGGKSWRTAPSVHPCHLSEFRGNVNLKAGGDHHPGKLMIDENPPAPLEVSNPPIPPENPAPPVQASPPATALVLNGTKSEREIELERKLDAETERAKKAEVIAAEWQRENEDLKTIPRPAPAPKPKRKHNWLSPVIGAEEED